ncbi:MAG: hypothetical protein M3Q10_13300 [Chloroflexota bacterium]|nr:hypothetical protein [Chloroflexota bacterium]
MRDARRRHAGDPLRSPWHPDRIAATLRARPDRFGISYVVVVGHDLEPFAPIVARLAGT